MTFTMTKMLKDATDIEKNLVYLNYSAVMMVLCLGSEKAFGFMSQIDTKNMELLKEFLKAESEKLKDSKEAVKLNDLFEAMTYTVLRHKVEDKEATGVSAKLADHSYTMEFKDTKGEEELEKFVQITAAYAYTSLQAILFHWREGIVRGERLDMDTSMNKLCEKLGHKDRNSLMDESLKDIQSNPEETLQGLKEYIGFKKV